jgi:hypothetical protein
MDGTAAELAGSKRFVVQRQLGRGGMGVVYAALDREWNTVVAVKTLHVVNPEALVRLKNEFRALSGIHHPNLVRLGDLVEEGGSWLITMELVDGADLMRWVRPDGRLDEARLRASLPQLVEALHLLHRTGRVHRDVKPSNVLVTGDGRVVLLDFGLITREATDDALTDGMVVGTAEYMAPEQATGAPVTVAADWYALGVMLYEALTGRLPFVGPPPLLLEAKQTRAPAAPSAIAPGVPPDLEALCLALLARDPDERLGGHALRAAVGLPPAEPPLGAVEPRFIGRVDELGQLEEAFARARAGESITLFVHGESGIGKSALLRQFLRRVVVAYPSTWLLEGRCYARERLPFKGFDGIVDVLMRRLAELAPAELLPLLPDDVDLLAAIFPVLRRVTAIAIARSPRTAPETARRRRQRAFVALRELLGRVAARAPLLMTIEDLQWADDDTLTLRREVMAGRDLPGRLLVATLRSGDDARDRLRRAVLSTHESPGEVLEVELGRLDGDESRRLVGELLGPARAADAAAMVPAGEGHPLFLTQLARFVVERPLPRGPSSPAEALAAADLHDVIWSRVQALSAEARRVMEVLALCDSAVARPVVVACADVDGGAYARVDAETRAAALTTSVATAGPLAGVEPYHDQIREAVRTRMPPSRRRELHRRLAEALEHGGAEPRLIYEHWLGAGETARAAQASEAAAERADRLLAFEQAAQGYERALALDDNVEHRRRLLPRLAAALANAGHPREAADTWRLAAALADGRTRSSHLRAAAEILIRTGHVDDGVDLLRTVLEELGLSWPATPRWALASLVWRRALVRLRGYDFDERAEAEVDPRALLRLDTVWSAAVALSMVDRIRGEDFQARGLLEALRAGEVARVARAIALEVAYSSTLGTPEQERTSALLVRARRLAERCDEPYPRALTMTVTGMAALSEGRFAEAEKTLASAETMLRACGAQFELATASYYRMVLLALLGRLGELERNVRQLRDEAQARDDLYTMANLSNGWSAIAPLRAGHIAAGRVALVETMGMWSRRGFHQQHASALLAESNFDLYEGQVEAAARRVRQAWRPLRRSLLLRTQFSRIVLVDLRARVALAVGDAADAGKCATQLWREDAAWAQALAALLRAQLDGQRGAFAVAAAMFDAVDMRLHAAVARRRAGEADPYFAREGVRDADAIVRCFAPGGAR